jgi:hypothetical protein
MPDCIRRGKYNFFNIYASQVIYFSDHPHHYSLLAVYKTTIKNWLSNISVISFDMSELIHKLTKTQYLPFSKEYKIKRSAWNMSLYLLESKWICSMHNSPSEYSAASSKKCSLLVLLATAHRVFCIRISNILLYDCRYYWSKYRIDSYNWHKRSVGDIGISICWK